jgi:outer membrane biosynthesis protein TonB
MVHEYKVIPAPIKGRKARGIRKPEDKFAFAVQETMNEMAQLGWEFVRSETLPNTERTGLTRRTTTERSLLVFRREVVQTPRTSLEATLREVEKPEPIAADPEATTTEDADPRKSDVANTQDPQAVADRDEDTVVPLPTPAPKETIKLSAQPKPAPKPKRIAAVEDDSFPDPRPSESPRPESQALYTKDSVAPAKGSKSNALPAALRSRASQSSDGNKA